MRVVKTERARFRVHQPRERREVGRHGQRERGGRVVRGLDQRALDKLVHGEVLVRAEVDRRLADDRSARVGVDDVGQLVMLQRDEHGHQLRDRGDRQVLACVVGREHVARARVLHDVRPCVHVRRRRERARRQVTDCYKDYDEQQRASHRSRIFSPMNKEVDFTFGFSCSIVATATPDLDEITPKVSPACTVQNR